MSYHHLVANAIDDVFYYERIHQSYRGDKIEYGDISISTKDALETIESKIDNLTIVDLHELVALVASRMFLYWSVLTPQEFKVESTKLKIILKILEARM